MEREQLIKTYVKDLLISLIIGAVATFSLKSYTNFGQMIGYIYALGAGYWGWISLNKIQPNIFLVMPIVGWVFYFLIKLILSLLVGFIAFPIQTVLFIIKLNKIKNV